MDSETRQRILDIFNIHSGYAKTSDLISEGIHHKYLKELTTEGAIIRLRHGLYSLPEIENYTTFHEALLIIQDGIICMGSALAYHELTTWDPPDIHIAITRGRKIVLPDYPPIKLYHFSKPIIDLGRQEIMMDNGKSISIYDRERCVCDAVRFRNRIGIDIMKEVLREYMTGSQKDINTLNEYAKAIRISSVLNQYLDVLL